MDILLEFFRKTLIDFAGAWHWLITPLTIPNWVRAIVITMPPLQGFFSAVNQFALTPLFLITFGGLAMVFILKLFKLILDAIPIA